jgi:hypothetical protein
MSAQRVRTVLKMVRDAGRITSRRLPALYLAWSRIRPKPYLYRDLQKVYDSILQRYGSTVLSGPFKGMAYFPSYATLFSYVLGTAATPKLVGCYEAELHPVIGLALAGDSIRVVNVGAAEGYYAVGFARSPSITAVLAFDKDPLARALSVRLARMNAVQGKFQIRGAIRPAELERAITGKCLIIVDCEGCELDLLTTIRAARFSNCDLLVETHEFIVPGSADAITAHFRSTHKITEISMQERDPLGYPMLEHLSPEMRRLAVNEFRPLEEAWLFMTPV